MLICSVLFAISRKFGLFHVLVYNMCRYEQLLRVWSNEMAT